MTPLLTLDDLANLMGRSPSTVTRNLRRNPAAVPPRLSLPGTRLLRWRAEDVDEWLRAHVMGEISRTPGGLPDPPRALDTGGRRGPARMTSG